MKNVILYIFFLLTLSCNHKVSNINDTIIKDKIEQKIIIYGSATCHYCTDTKAYLIKKNTPFIFYDLDTNPSKITEMHTKLRKANISTANFQIPVVDKGGKIITNDYESFEVFLSKLN